MSRSVGLGVLHGIIISMYNATASKKNMEKQRVENNKCILYFVVVVFLNNKHTNYI